MVDMDDPHHDGPDEADGDSFALLDFALTPAPARQVAQAFAASLAPVADASGSDAASGGLSRLWTRLRGARAPAPDPVQETLTVHPDEMIPDGPMARLSLDPPAEGAHGLGPVRLSGPLGPGAYTLIERRLPPGDPHDAWAKLSAALGPAEVFCFRYSGQTHPGADFRFRVLTAGRATRDVRARSPEGVSVEAPWQGHDTGMPHPFEAESLPPPGAAPMTLMNAGRLASILTAMGLAPEDMFYDVALRRDMLVLADMAGGLPLDAVLARAGQGPLRRPSDPAPAAAPVADDTSTFAVTPPNVPQTPAPAADPALPALSESWEDEVTAILVAAVEAGLPEEEQVPWLDQLTGQLNSGDIDGALTRAAELIRHGDRPAEQRIAAAARLAALFEARNDGAPLS